MSLRLESADRFWEIMRDGKRVVVSHGPLGGEVKIDVQTFFLERRAIAAYDMLVVEQRAAGFTEVFALPEPTARNPELEAAIREHRDDPAPYDVYADWLQDHDNPFGELILLQRALETAHDPAKEKRMAALRRAYGAANPAAFTVTWQWGFWRMLRVDNEAAVDNFDAIAELRPVFSRFACSQLDELRIGYLRWDFDAVDVPALLAEIGTHAWATGLRRLFLGDAAHIDLGMQTVGPIGEVIGRAVPNLRSLHIRTGDPYGDQPMASANPPAGYALSFAGLALPRLESLTIETCSMSRILLGQLLAAQLPELTALELWFGSSTYGADCTIADLAAILDGEVFPHLTSLGLCNFELEDQLARMIHTARLAPQLTHLNLSKGTLDDESALVLAGHRYAFPALKTLDVRDNFLTPASIAALRAAFAGVEVEASHQRKAAGDRYVAVTE